MAYIAGFFDGEGYATIRRANRYKGGCSFRACIGFVNKNRDLLLWIQTFFAGNIYKKKRKCSRHSQAYELVSSKNSEIIWFLDNVYPFLKIKKSQCDLLRELLNLGHMKKIGEWPRFIPMIGEVEKREEIKNRITELNKRGN